MSRSGGGGRALEWAVAALVVGVLSAGAWIGLRYWIRNTDSEPPIPAPARVVTQRPEAVEAGDRERPDEATAEVETLEMEGAGSAGAGAAPAGAAADRSGETGSQSLTAAVPEPPLPEVVAGGAGSLPGVAAIGFEPTPLPTIAFETLAAPEPDAAWPDNEMALPAALDGGSIEGWPVQVVPRRLLVFLNPDATEDEFLTAAARSGTRPKLAGRVPAFRLLAVDTGLMDLGSARNVWLKLDAVRAVLYDEVWEEAEADPALASRDPADDWHVHGLGLPAAWGRVAGDPNSFVAVLDGAPDANHPELAGKLAAAGSEARPAPGGRPETSVHATIGAVLAAGRLGNGFGAAGVAPGGRVLPIVVVRRGRSATSALLAGVDRAVAFGAAVVLVPLQPRLADGLIEAYRSADTRSGAVARLAAWRREGAPLAAVLGERLVDGGSLLVLAAGNRVVPPDFAPWSLADGVLVVAASGPDGRRAADSSDGQLVWALAPGNGVPVPLDAGRAEAFEPRSGTSVAAAAAAGVCLLLRQAAPGLAAIRARQLLSRDVPGADAGAGWYEVRRRLLQGPLSAEEPQHQAEGARLLRADRLIEALGTAKAICGAGGGLASDLARRLLEGRALEPRAQWEAEKTAFGEAGAGTPGSFEQWLARRSELGLTDETVEAVHGQEEALIAAVAAAVAEAGARGPAALASGLDRAEAVLLQGPQRPGLGPSHLRSGTWSLLFPCGGGICAVSAIGGFRGRLPRRELRVFELDPGTLAPRVRVQFAEPLLDVTAPERLLLRRDRFGGAAAGADALAQTGLCPRPVLAELREGRSVPLGETAGRSSELRFAGRDVLSLEVNGTAVDLPVLKADVVVRISRGGSVQAVSALRYTVAENERWPVLVLLEDLQRGVSTKPLSVFALRCG
jgi:hypothetical protein